MEPATLERFKRQLEEMEADLRDAVEGGADATAPVELDTSIGRLSRMDAIQSQQMYWGDPRQKGIIMSDWKETNRCANSRNKSRGATTLLSPTKDA